MTILLQPYRQVRSSRLRLPAPETPIRMHHPARLRSRGRVLRGLCGPRAAGRRARRGGCGDDPIASARPAAADRGHRDLRWHGDRQRRRSRSPSSVGPPARRGRRLTALEPADATIGLSIGTWNGVSLPACASTLANDNATVARRAHRLARTATGNYCVRVYDVGKLTQAAATSSRSRTSDAGWPRAALRLDAPAPVRLQACRSPEPSSL